MILKMKSFPYRMTMLTNFWLGILMIFFNSQKFNCFDMNSLSKSGKIILISEIIPELKQVNQIGIDRCFQAKDNASSVLFKKNATFNEYLNELKNIYSVIQKQHTFTLSDRKRIQINTRMIVQHVVRCSNSSRKNYFKVMLNQMILENLEIRKQNLGLKSTEIEPRSGLNCDLELPLEAPPTYDFRALYEDKVKVKNRIRDEGNCKSSYAMVAVGVVEGAFIRKGFTNQRFSPQYIIDFSTMQGNKGCHYGSGPETFIFIQENGLPYEYDYPYLAEQQTNPRKPQAQIKIDDWCFTFQTSDQLRKKQLVNYGPLWTEISINDYLIFFYKSGIFFSDEKNILFNHALLLVGYDEESWILRNSWGTNFGENGYLRVARVNNKQKIGGHSAFVKLQI